jgi:hypothetical protein
MGQNAIQPLLDRGPPGASSSGYLIRSASVRCLQLVACFSKVRGMLVDVFGAIVYLRPSRRHYHVSTRFRRVNRDNGLR